MTEYYRCKYCLEEEVPVRYELVSDPPNLQEQRAPDIAARLSMI